MVIKGHLTVIVDLLLDDLNAQDDAELRERLQVVDVYDLRPQLLVQARAQRLQVLTAYCICNYYFDITKHTKTRTLARNNSNFL